jgi:5-methylcytosine-specific restriction protein A
LARADNWSKSEIVAAVAEYLQLLSLEKRGETFSPTAIHRKLAASALVGRSEGSVARRMSNISSVLDKSGKRWVSRYKPSLDHVGTRVSNIILDALIELENVGPTDGLDLINQAHSVAEKGPINRPVGGLPAYSTYTKRDGFHEVRPSCRLDFTGGQRGLRGMSIAGPFLVAFG